MGTDSFAESVLRSQFCWLLLVGHHVAEWVGCVYSGDRTAKSVGCLRLLLPTFADRGTQGLISRKGTLEKDLLFYLHFLASISCQGSISIHGSPSLSFSKFKAERHHLFHLTKIKDKHSNGIISNTCLSILSQIMYAAFMHQIMCASQMQQFPIF